MKKYTYLIVLTLLAPVIFVLGYQFIKQTYRVSDRHIFFAMDTFFEIQSNEKINWNKILKQIQTDLALTDGQLNAYQKNSEIETINQNASKEPVKVSEVTFVAIKKAIEFGISSKGLFDISFQPLQDLYGFEEGKYRVPTPQEIEETKKSVNFAYIKLNEDRQEVQFMKPGMKINLSGLIKGIALDRIVKYLQNEGIHEFSLNFGGNLYIQSEKEETIGIKNPSGNYIIASILVKNGFVSTSSDGEQYFIQDNQRYSHIINPITGSAISSNESVTVVSDSGILSDFLSTYLYLLPIEEISEYMQDNFPETGYYVIQNNKIVLSKDQTR